MVTMLIITLVSVGAVAFLACFFLALCRERKQVHCRITQVRPGESPFVGSSGKAARRAAPVATAPVTHRDMGIPA